ncbi:ComF family protein [Streptococcus parasanguinis]|uniref:ComF family protein n=1 Tax=Streptococcus parasanguinis TaxID=1318 RepID=A0A7X2X5E9_STRPA|nr:ComF family protein [Streptococcus parasanguinis]MTS55100.1 ComF family protein [Streptococcus parasanguinis]RYS55731.1 ComF family protein [Streptococcus parasanguinis]
MKECLLCTKELKTGEHFTDLIFMKQQEEWICKECKEDFEQICEIHCPRCYKDKEEKVCKDCEYWIQKGNMVEHEALYRYNAAMKDYFKRYKFEGDRLLGMVFACDIKKALKKYKSYTIIPTPISHEKKQERGFNQVSTILDFAEIKYNNLFQKEDTLAQSKKTREERLKTSQHFQIKGEVSEKQKYLIFDDIYTTGKTIELMKRLLIEKGVKEIKTFSIAR